MKLLIMQSSPSSYYSSLLTSNYSRQHYAAIQPSMYNSPTVRVHVSYPYIRIVKVVVFFVVCALSIQIVDER
jgi:hypothetical protein